eukprot:1726897-Pyramimonas_sp.AAC.1
MTWHGIATPHGGGWGASAAEQINESTPNVQSLLMVSSRSHCLKFGAHLNGPKPMPGPGTRNNDASAAVGARFETSGSAGMRPALQQGNDSERA